MPGEFSRTVIHLFQREAQDQGGLLSGKDPTDFNTSDPLRLWIVQMGVIVAFSSLLALILRKIQQPRVIAEVLGGILLGPSAFGRIPGFTEHIFPSDSKPYLSLVADIGLCLFLFLVGLEIDSSIIKRNARLSATIALAGMAVPFGVGAGLSVGLYHQFIDPSIQYTHFMLFTGVAFSITAFPVLCRILTELKLLDTTVGIVVLSAGVGNDVVGWTLLALSVALVNAGSGLTALWILLTCVGWALLLLFPGRFALRWLAVKTDSINNGPSMFFITVTLMVLFGSAFFADIIGVNAIFGAFIAGVIVPREGGLTIALTEKLEDLTSIIFLPLYFTLSGLSTNLGLLNNGITWAYTIAICAVSFTGKFGACCLAARFVAGFNWRESSAIGSLMSCKGLVELIVLNVGLSAGILSQRVFSMFVLEALLLTFITTPLVNTLYPADKRVRAVATGSPFFHVPGQAAPSSSSETSDTQGETRKSRFTIVLDKLDHLPSMMALTQLIEPISPTESVTTTPASATTPHDAPRGCVPLLSPAQKSIPTHLEVLRFIELSDRTSAVMKSSAADTILQTDPLLAVFKMFGQLNNFVMSTALSIVPYDDLSRTVAKHAQQASSDMIMIPWLPPYPSIDNSALPATPRTTAANPFDTLFGRGGDSSIFAVHSQFVRGVFMQAETDVALFVDQEGTLHQARSSSRQHLFVPFFGGPDDRLALEFVVQLCENPRISATIIKLSKAEVDPALAKVENAYLGGELTGEGANNNMLTVTSAATNTFPDTVYDNATTQVRMQSETADRLAWSKYSTSVTERSGANYPSPAALSRMEFKELLSPIPLHATIQAAKECDVHTRLYVVLGRSRRLAVEDHSQELKVVFEEKGAVPTEVRKTVGDVAAAFLASRCGSSLVVVQTAGNSLG
ncbi:hypothetical protein FISHEDRAFT_66875 [Fistulina hepatica ATCC 64428]|uniref:Cation/H+ exchanger transmembrane domain-containing protein n=1 Tax=Fistulina hepatica ATCC 64428 TaxID=1128425 RepID=A0A0D7A3I1_9AGAR|nr:hypothetical protein FISHEDRAFT_66875 [Fistulina hepatica ATCC 64428]